MLDLFMVAAFVAQPLPDQLDILRGVDSVPQIQLLLDTSGSMGWDPAASVCDYYPTQQADLIGSYESGGTWFLSRTDQLKAALTGCKNANDGILDQWSTLAMFSVREFGARRTNLLAGFDVNLSNLPELEDAVMNLQTDGVTPLARAYREGARYFRSFFNDTNSETCRQNYMVIMTDGVGNGSGRANFNFVDGQPDLSVADAGTCFGTNDTTGCAQPPYPDQAASYLFEDALGNEVDVLHNLEGQQPIRTYTIGFQAPTAADALLRAMAAAGDGQAYSATSYEQLSAAFSEIISTIIVRSRVAFSGGAFAGDGLFAGNYMYASPFRTRSNGVWVGSTKKFCMMPPPEGGTDCLFIHGNKPGELIVNPEPMDQWTQNSDPRADTGGTGQQLLTLTYKVPNQYAAPPPNALSLRNIRTWRAGSSGFVMARPENLKETETWSSDRCSHYALFNDLYGFGDTVTDCAAQDYSPSVFSSWPQADTVSAGTILLQYTPNCEQSDSKCVVVTANNGGMIHFFNAYNGLEMGALIPAELWAPNGVAHHRLGERSDQPALDAYRRYFIDGKMRLFHEDEDGDFLIDKEERAQLIVGLGRGGRGYYLIDVNDFDGFLRAEYNPPRPLVPDTQSLKHLKDTWAAPASSVLPDGVGGSIPVAIFPSGHIPRLDDPNAPFGGPVSIERAPSPDRLDAPFSATCTQLGIPPDFCATADFTEYCDDIGLTCSAGSACSACTDPDPDECVAQGFSLPFCYDWPGWAVLPREAGSWAAYPTDMTVGPLLFNDGTVSKGEGYRVNFGRFDLQSGDYVSFLDENDVELARVEGTDAPIGAMSSPWLLTPAFSMRVVTDGNNVRPAEGYTIASIDVIRDAVPPAKPEVHHPSIFVNDLRRWNHGELQSPPYTSSSVGTFGVVDPDGSTMSDGLILRFTDSCAGVSPGENEVCIDQDTSTRTVDLQWMVCPISAEPTMFNEGGSLTAIYFGDECGQIWRLRREVDEQWSASRILRLNNARQDGYTFSGSASKDYRKIFTKLDLVNSTCPGQRSVGVYFGTGNVQRPAATDALDDPAITRASNSLRSTERNVVGVVWDNVGLPANLSLSDLTNVTDTRQVDPSLSSNSNGWYIELDQDERMLRDPLVFDGLAFYDVYLARGIAAKECTSNLGRNRTLVMDNCTALGYGNPGGNPLLPPTPNEERTAAMRDNAAPGSGLSFIAPKSGSAFVSLGLEGGVVGPSRNRSGAQIVRFWRLED